MKYHPVCPFSIARVRVDDETLGLALYSGRELVGAKTIEADLKDIYE
jgi:hypothetical protein